MLVILIYIEELMIANRNSENISLIRSTASGSLSKAWYNINGKTCLVKGDSIFCYEPFSEAYASIVADILNVPHIRYAINDAAKFREVETTSKGFVSVCELYNIEQDYSRITLWDYICESCRGRALNPRMINTDDAFSIMLELDKYVVDRIFSVLHFDAIICNVDRHMCNIELIRDTDGHICSSLPVFDCSSSLLYTNSNDWENDACSAFKTTHAEQVKQIINHGYVSKISKVDNFKELFEYKAKHVFEVDPRKDIKDRLLDFLGERVCRYV